MSIIITLIFILLFIGIRRIKSLDSVCKSLLTVYVVIWWYSCFFSRLQFYNLNSVDARTTWFVILHVIAFLVGFALFFRLGKSAPVVSKDIAHTLGFQVERLQSNAIFIIALGVSTIYVLIKFVYFFQTVQINNAIDVRGDFFEGDLYGKDYVVVNGLLLMPMNYICTVLWSWDLLKKRNITFVVISLFLILNNSLAGGRLGYVYIAIALLFMLVLLRVRIARYAPMILSLVVLGYLAFAYIGAARFGGTADMTVENIRKNGIEITNEQIFTYTAAPVVAFDYSLNNDFVSQIGGHSYGGIVFAPVVQFVYVIMNMIGMPFEQPFTRYAERIQDGWIDNGNSNWNALYTSVNVYYLDAGILGIVFYPLLFGALFCWMIAKFNKTQSIWHLFLLSYFYTMIFCSIMSYLFITQFAFMMVAFYFVMGNMKKQSKKNQICLK